MVMCWVPDCKHYNQRDTCKFFVFPTDEKLREQWKKLIRRDVEPGPGAHICSCHFKEGKRENRPTIFLHNAHKIFSFGSPEKRKSKVHKALSVPQQNFPAHEMNEGICLPSTSMCTRTVLGEISDNEAPMDVVESCSSDLQCLPSRSKPTLTATTNAENYFLQQELSATKLRLSKLSVQFSYEHICNNDKLIVLYTGIPNNAIFHCLLDLIKDAEVNYYLQWNVNKISQEDQVLMTLMKLRHNFPHQDLAVRFNVSQATVTNVIITWIYALHQILFKTLMASIPSRAQNKLCMPNCFSTFTNCRIIIDCTEIYTMVPRNSMLKQKLTFSSYKHRNTWKVLIGVAPNGVITFVSDLYPGSTSDKKIVQNCGILNQMEAGDLILADKGFLIKDCLPPGVYINVPPFLTTPQFSPQQVYETENIARARIHVERAIRRMKCYNILNLIPETLFQHADVVVQLIGSLTNLQFPLIKEVEQYYFEQSQ